MARRRKRGCFFRFLTVLLAASVILCGYMALQGRIVRLESASVYLKDLPPAFDGTTVLFVTDPHVGSFASGSESADLITSLQSLYPDLLLLGGDYAGEDPFSASDTKKTLSECNSFFQSLGWFYAPLGKFAVQGCCDKTDSLSEAMATGGIVLLDNQVARLEKDGSYLYLAGLGDWKTGSQILSSVDSLTGSQDTVLVLSHDPEAFTASVREGEWFDFMLCGGTHGGQIFFPFLNKLLPSASGYRSGWYRQNNSLLLVSNGLGTSFLPFRLNAPAQIFYLTLHTEQAG